MCVFEDHITPTGFNPRMAKPSHGWGALGNGGVQMAFDSKFNGNPIHPAIHHSTILWHVHPWDGFAIRGITLLFYSSLISVLSAQG